MANEDSTYSAVTDRLCLLRSIKFLIPSLALVARLEASMKLPGTIGGSGALATRARFEEGELSATALAGHFSGLRAEESGSTISTSGGFTTSITFGDGSVAICSRRGADVG